MLSVKRGHWFGAALLLSATSCESTARIEAAAAASSDFPTGNGPEGVADPPSSQQDAGPIRVVALDDTHPTVFVVRGRGIGPGRLVFLHGMCGHGLGYAQSFQHASARKGTLIAPQADVVCGAL